jgi:D-arabinitol 4-dehydrogenase
MSEAFLQWIIEDYDFCTERPNWETVGVTMVKNVELYEEAKIRILNASHSCIAWGGCLFGYQSIHEGAQHSMIRQWAFDYITDAVIPCLHSHIQEGEGSYPFDLSSYRDIVLDRFSNIAILDTNQRVTQDSLSKIAGFIAPTVFEALEANRSITSVMRLPALYLCFLQLWYQNKLRFSYQDATLDAYVIAKDICESTDPILHLVSLTSLWGKFANDDRLIDAFRKTYTEVREQIQSSQTLISNQLELF